MLKMSFLCFSVSLKSGFFPPVNHRALTVHGTHKALGSSNFCLDSFTVSDFASVLHPHLVAESASSNLALVCGTSCFQSDLAIKFMQSSSGAGLGADTMICHMLLRGVSI